MAIRRSIDIQSFSHQNPIPAASRIGPLVASSIIAPFDPGTRNLPEGVDAQLANLFHHVGQMLEAAGADWRHIAKMTFFVTDIAYRDAINGPWAEKFPDPASRPARHTQTVTPAGKLAVSCDFLAYVE
jgi:enamine deaminase RidA (YjgF/YER057c/UK114 family)